MSVARTERLLNLFTTLLHARAPMAFAELCELDAFAAYRGPTQASGERTFDRDKAELGRLGVPLIYVGDPDDGAPGYRIDAGRYSLPQQDMGPEELATAAMVGAAAYNFIGFGHAGPLRRALLKLGFDADDEPCGPALHVMSHLPARPGPQGAALQALLDDLLVALGEARRLCLVYARGAATAAPNQTHHAMQACVSERVVDPWGLYYRQGAWYLVGWCHARKTRRTFHLARIRAATSLGPANAFAVPQDLNMRAIARIRPWQFGVHVPVAVPIWVHPDLLAAVGEIFGPPGPDLHLGPVRADGGRIVTCRATCTDALLQQVLPYGARLEVLAPQSLRERLCSLYEQARALHAEAAA